MRFFIAVFCGLVLQVSSLAQEKLSVDVVSIDQFKSSFTPFIASVKNSNSSDFKILKKLFNHSHQEYLKNYVAYSQVNDIFEKGNYDCLSGTYFFCLSSG